MQDTSPQPGPLQDGVTHALCIEWRCRIEGPEALARLSALRPASATVGIGSDLAEAMGLAIPGLRPFAALLGAKTFPATQYGLWAFVPGADPSAAYDASAQLEMALGPGFEPAESVSLFRYRGGRDLLGYRAGTANPHGKVALRAAFLGRGPWQHGTFALLQRYRHDSTRFAALSAEAQDAVLGVSRGSGTRLATAPATAHVKRVHQESLEPAAYVVRRSLSWGTPARHGEQVIIFAADLDRIAHLLERMAGIADGLGDALLDYSVPETGAFYFCPPLDGGRLKLRAGD